MARLPLRTTDDAPEAAKALLQNAEKRNGFLPNLLRILANTPTALETYLTVSGINAHTSLSVAERETVQIIAAATHGCGFCVAGHTAAAYKQAGLDKATVDALRNLGHVPDQLRKGFLLATLDVHVRIRIVSGLDEVEVSHGLSFKDS